MEPHHDFISTGTGRPPDPIQLPTVMQPDGTIVIGTAYPTQATHAAPPPPLMFPTQLQPTGPTLGRVLRYCLTESDCGLIRANRTARGMGGNSVRPGQTFPAIVVSVNDNLGSLNLQVALDGPDLLWVTSAHRDEAARAAQSPGTWRWPPIS